MYEQYCFGRSHRREYHKTLLPTATSYGKTILADGKYVGDIWCYCIDKTDMPNAMLSYCVFDESSWNKGIATDASSIIFQDILLDDMLTKCIIHA